MQDPDAGLCIWPCWTSGGLHRPAPQACPGPSGWSSLPSGESTAPIGLTGRIEETTTSAPDPFNIALRNTWSVSVVLSCPVAVSLDPTWHSGSRWCSVGFTGLGSLSVMLQMRAPTRQQTSLEGSVPSRNKGWDSIISWVLCVSQLQAELRLTFPLHSLKARLGQHAVPHYQSPAHIPDLALPDELPSQHCYWFEELFQLGTLAAMISTMVFEC